MIRILAFGAAPWLIAAAAALSPAPSLADDAIAAPFQADYVVYRNGSELGQASMSLSALPDGQWLLETHTRGTRGLAAMAGVEIVERSTFAWRGDVPELSAYDYRQRMSFRNRERSLRLSDDGASITSRQDAKKTWQLRREPDVIDRHAVVLALARKVAADRPELSFRVADRDDIETQRYRRAGDETVSVPAGTFKAVRIDRIREKPGRETTTWFAKEIGFLPVKVLHSEADGETIEMRLIARPQNGAATAAASGD